MKQPAFIEPCPQWLAQQNALHTDDLTSEERAQLHAHLSACERCRAVQEQYEAINQLILDLPRARPLPALPVPLQATMSVSHEVRTGDSPSPVRRFPPSAATQRHKIRLKGSLNLAATLLVVIVLLSGFLLLFDLRQSSGGAATGSSFYVLTSTGHGTFTSKVVSADSGAERVIWQQQIADSLLGYGYIIVHNTFYFPTIDGNVYALRDHDGQILWHTDFHFGNGEQLGWLMTYQNMIVAIVTHRDDGSGDLYGLNEQTGATVWHTHIVCGPSSPANCAGQGRIVKLTNGIIYAMAFDGVSAWNAANGSFLWRNPKYFFNGQPNALAVVRNKVYVTNFSPKVDVLDATTGRYLHSIVAPLEPQDATGIVITITADENNVYILGGKSITAYRVSDDVLVWDRTLAYHSESSIFVSKNVLYVNGHNVTFGGGLNASPGPFTNDVYALNPADGQQLWYMKLPDLYTSQPPVEANGVLCFASGNNLTGIRASDGTELWKLKEQDEVLGLLVA